MDELAIEAIVTTQHQDAGLGRSAEDRRAAGTRTYQRLTQQTERGLAELSDEMGPTLAQFVIDYCLGELWERPHLDLKVRSLILVGALTSMGDTRALRTHVRGALAHGATPDEVREIFVFLSGYVGFPRVTGASEVAEEVLKGLEDARQDAEPRMHFRDDSVSEAQPTESGEQA